MHHNIGPSFPPTPNHLLSDIVHGEIRIFPMRHRLASLWHPLAANQGRRRNGGQPLALASCQTSTQIRLALRQLLQNVCQDGHLACRDDLLGVRGRGCGGNSRRFRLCLDDCFGRGERSEGRGGEEEGGEVGLGDDRGLRVRATGVTFPVLRRG